MELKDVLIRPIITEKSTSHLATERTYAFEVAPLANKVQIKRAVEKMYGVAVTDVHTLNQRGKEKRRGKYTAKLQNWKKAYVTLAEGHSLNLYSNQQA